MRDTPADQVWTGPVQTCRGRPGRQLAQAHPVTLGNTEAGTAIYSTGPGEGLK